MNNGTSSADLWVFGHLLHLLFSIRDRNGDGVGAGQSRIPGSDGVDDLSHKHEQKQKRVLQKKNSRLARLGIIRAMAEQSNEGSNYKLEQN